MDKILIITPHLSTGGLPQFLLNKIEILIQKYNVFLVEWENITGGVYTVQRDKLVNLLESNFISLSENKSKIFDIINDIKPNIIHFEEFSETFIDKSILRRIYSNKDYYITETTHGTLFNRSEKQFIPDKLMLVSGGNYNQYMTITEDCDVIKYPSKMDSKMTYLRKLGLDPSWKHVLNVGLFTPGKNQGEIFKIARQLEKYKIKFHFIGNQAVNFKDYWEPLMSEKPDNCIVWGEREDVSDFYKSCDIFLFTSKLENRPLSVLEAINFDLPVFMYNLQNYGDDFSKSRLINFLTSDLETNTKLILKELNPNLREWRPVGEKSEKSSIESVEKIKAYHILTDIDTEREIRSISDISKLEDFGISYTPIISKRWTELPPAETCAFPEIISLEPGGKLTPAHYGCYLGHRMAFERGFEENPDYMLIFECDAILDVSHTSFIKGLNRAVEIIEKEDLFMFSLGFHNGQSIIERGEDYFVVSDFIGAHAYLIPQKSFDFIWQTYKIAKWNVTDLWLGNNFKQFRHGIFQNPITKQAGGISILENLKNEDRY